MRNITKAFILLMTVIFYSCQDENLTKDNATDIVKECESKANKPSIKTIAFNYGEVRVNTTMNKRFGDKMNRYYELQEMGLVTIDTLATKNGSLGSKTEVFNVELTPKAEELIIGKVNERSGVLSAKFKICEYRFKEIREVQNIPESNAAKVKVVFERFNETPFFVEANKKKNPKEIVKTVPYRKTTDGWKLCD